MSVRYIDDVLEKLREPGAYVAATVAGLPYGLKV